jgi:ADP-ribose pyrophosphatase
VSAKRWTPLGLYYPAPGLFTEIIHLYLARELTVGAAKPDVDEELELQWLPFGAAMAKILTGEWNDGKTALAMLRAQSHLQL